MIKQMFFFSFKLIKLECLPEPHAKKILMSLGEKRKKPRQISSEPFSFLATGKLPKEVCAVWFSVFDTKYEKKKWKRSLLTFVKWSRVGDMCVWEREPDCVTQKGRTKRFHRWLCVSVDWFVRACVLNTCSLPTLTLPSVHSWNDWCHHNPLWTEEHWPENASLLFIMQSNCSNQTDSIYGTMHSF